MPDNQSEPGVADVARVQMGSVRGVIYLQAQSCDGVRRGAVIMDRSTRFKSESI